ncbi:MAG: hypothetical protein KTR31_34290 [Myxococcales bacterium]|nr:hypothetical protein [Myxococcales bacterium]
MSRLPTPDEQDWILEELGALVQARGPDPLVRGPIWLPTDEAFPDPWNGDVPSLERLLRRILGYVGLDHLKLLIERFEGESTVDHVSAHGEASYRHHGAAAWFGGIHRDVAHFGCAVQQLEEAGEQLVGVLAHEAAHAYRHEAGLVRDDRDEEECLTDLTTIYLGFGVFTVNNTYRYRSFAEERGAALYSGYRWSQSGYLSPQMMSFAFAATLRARTLGWWPRWRLLRWLEPNQRGYTRAALRQLQGLQLKGL